MLKKIRLLKDVELDFYRRDLTSSMGTLITYYNQSGKLKNSDLDLLIIAIEKYKELNNE